MSKREKCEKQIKSYQKLLLLLFSEPWQVLLIKFSDLEGPNVKCDRCTHTCEGWNSDNTILNSWYQSLSGKD